MVVDNETACLRCETEFEEEVTRVDFTIESSELDPMGQQVEKTQALCGDCYEEYLEFVHEYT